MSTVLVVEDDLPLARTWTRVLVEYDVVLAHDRRRARALLEDAAGPPIDAVLLDLKLPDGDGEKLIPDLHRRHPRARICVVTGSEDSARHLSLQVRGYLVLKKPVTLEAIRLAISAMTTRPSDPVLEAAAAWGLTPMQTKVLEAGAAGKSNKVVAAELGLSECGVKRYWERIGRRAGVVGGKTYVIARARAWVAPT